jgi:hypothetical protein
LEKADVHIQLADGCYVPEAVVNLGILNGSFPDSCRSDSTWQLPLSAHCSHLELKYQMLLRA